MIDRTHRFCNWLSAHVCVWRTQGTAGPTVVHGLRPSHRRCFVLVILGLSGGLLQWYVGRDEARPVQLGLMVSEQTVAYAEAALRAPTTMAAATATDAVDTASVMNTMLSAPSAPLIVPTTLVTDGAVPTESFHECVSPLLQSAVSEVGTDVTMLPRRRIVGSTGLQRRHTTSRQQQQRRPEVRHAPPRGLSVLAIASRSALIRLPQGLLITVQAGAWLQGWTVERFSPAGLTLTHDDQRTVLSMTAEPRQRR